MSRDDLSASDIPASSDGIVEFRRQESLLKTGALQDAIFNSANFSSIATDEKGVIQIFNVGAERMLGYSAEDVVNKITPADISDPRELIARAALLSLELDTPIMLSLQSGICCSPRREASSIARMRQDWSKR
jgi:two-component system, cell cycle sensor histidine kinase PleC